MKEVCNFLQKLNKSVLSGEVLDKTDLLSEYKNFRNGIGLNEIRAVNARGHTWYYKYMEII